MMMRDSKHAIVYGAKEGLRSYERDRKIQYRNIIRGIEYIVLVYLDEVGPKKNQKVKW